MRAYMLLFLSVMLIGCTKPKADSAYRETEIPVPDKTDEESIPIPRYAGTVSFERLDAAAGTFHTDAHAPYVNDTLAFIPFPDQGVLSAKTAVVGSDVCMLYPESDFTISRGRASIKNENDMHGEPIPFASIVRIIGDKIINADTEPDDYTQRTFAFQDNYNWFYPAEWRGKTGYVFGADLFGLNDSPKKNRISAELYRTNAAYDAFYPATGYTPLGADVASALETHRVAFQKTPLRKSYRPDDMISFYREIGMQDSYIPYFISTDLIAHAQHLIFDRMLQHTEEFAFMPKLLSLTQNCIAALRVNADGDDETRDKAVMYFQVAEALLRTAPERVEKNVRYEKIVTYETPDESKILSSYPEAVVEDYRRIKKAETEAGFGSARELAVFPSVKDDFSQYAPRGHYTKNGVLEAYFRAMMWYGRIHFLIARADVEEGAVLETEKAALFIIDTVRKNAALYEAWCSLFNPITELIGLSDDLSFYDVLPLWKEQRISDFASWSSDKKNIINFMKLCREKLRPPAISSESALYGRSSDSAQQPAGWRFFGQRFTLDSAIHRNVSAPRLRKIVGDTIYGRTMVSGLDIIKAFGSRSADMLLENEYKEHEAIDFRETLDAIEREIDSYGDDYWNTTYYTQVLRQIKTLAGFESGTGFYFTETPLWNLKSLVTAHGAWAELRHDTILYTKQVYAEKGGDGDFEPTFRTEPIPRPTHYIEPNIPFWIASLNSVQKLRSVYTTYDLLDADAEIVLNGLLKMYQKILAICKKEAVDKLISDEENRWIPVIAAELEKYVLVHNGFDAAYTNDEDAFKMACIADVFTDAESGTVLETGIASPLRIYVALNDGQGGKRIAVGYCFSYAEFVVPINKRMTDEEWKKIVYRKDGNIEAYYPFWERGWIIPDDGVFSYY
ncbi:DUF3160 domain-containing protein [Treponema socranskii]|uniref:DUF3160 domain-containing protein n=1 Tax=Treponema socranskii TaxID=53419 RepID=UPI003D9169BC